MACVRCAAHLVKDGEEVEVEFLRFETFLRPYEAGRTFKPYRVGRGASPVSYTHLTLPTKRIV